MRVRLHMCVRACVVASDGACPALLLGFASGGDSRPGLLSASSISPPTACGGPV